MSADSSALDPYRPPSLPEGPYAAAPSSGRPGTLTALCVLCIVLGALGLMNSLMGTAGAIGGQQLQALVQPKASSDMPPEMQKAQQDFQDQLRLGSEQVLLGDRGRPGVSLRSGAAALDRRHSHAGAQGVGPQDAARGVRDCGGVRAACTPSCKAS